MHYLLISCSARKIGLYFRTGAQDHLQCFLGTCEGGRVDGEVAELVLYAELCSVLQLGQKRREMERKANREHFLFGDKAARGRRFV